MPTYIYQCDSCGVTFERLQRFSDEPLSECPECGGCVRRVIQPVGIVFRGSGFYVTDNRQVSSPTLKPPKDQDKAPDKAAGSGEKSEKEAAAPVSSPAKEPADPGTAPKKAAPETG